jgi:integrase
MRAKGTGYIKRRGKNACGQDAWQIILSWREHGRLRQKAETIHGTKGEATARLRELRTTIVDKGNSVTHGKLRVGDYLQNWLKDVVSIRNRPRTIEGYTLIVQKHIIPAIGSTQLNKLHSGDVQRMEADLLASGLSANTVHHVHICLSKSLTDAMRADPPLVDRNVCRAVTPPSPGRYEVTVPDIDAIGRILEKSRGTPYGVALHFAAFTGVRRGEVVALKWENVDLDRGVASIVESAQRLQGRGIVVQPTKSAAGHRGIALDPDTVEVLRIHRGQQLLNRMELNGAYDDNGLVFPGPLGKLLDPSALTRNFKKLAKAAGYTGMRLHDLRHGHAAGLMKAGVYPKTIQERLGHHSPAFTLQVYGHVAAGAQAEAANAFASLMANGRQNVGND